MGLPPLLCPCPRLFPPHAGLLRFPMPHTELKGHRARRISFPANRFKNWPFLNIAYRKFTRMAAKLRPGGRQTTPPGRAGKLPICSVKKHSCTDARYSRIDIYGQKAYNQLALTIS